MSEHLSIEHTRLTASNDPELPWSGRTVLALCDRISELTALLRLARAVVDQPDRYWAPLNQSAEHPHGTRTRTASELLSRIDAHLGEQGPP